MNLVEMAIEFRKELEAAKAIGRKYVLVNEISVEEMASIMSIYPTWESFEGKTIPKDEILRYGGELYQVIKGINWQSDWTPNAVPSEFNKITPSSTEDGTEIIADWEQRFGHNAYQISDKVKWTDGKIYECIVPNTVHTPQDAPRNWKLVE